MNEKEKIIEIEKQVFFAYLKQIPEGQALNGWELLESLADALIENGIGDVSEWKHRAEVAEKNDKIKKVALHKICKKEAENGCPFGYNPEKCAKCMQTEEIWGCTENSTQCYYEKAIQQAEREIEEERK